MNFFFALLGAFLAWGLISVTCTIIVGLLKEYINKIVVKQNEEERNPITTPTEQFVLLFKSLQFIEFEPAVATILHTGSKTIQKQIRYKAAHTDLTFVIMMQMNYRKDEDGKIVEIDWNQNCYFSVTMNPPMMQFTSRDMILLITFFNHYRLLRLADGLQEPDLMAKRLER